MQLVELLDSSLFSVVLVNLKLFNLLGLSFVHGIESFGECLKKRVHRLTHLLMEVLNFGIDIFHLLLGIFDIVSGFVQI